ncbi:Methyltransferase family protein [Frankia canadensis]|uniref:Methyltransferase family protein n=1 Tax=Frankia canadensis TaxID=1836972 RepID=A0A2I2KVF9_9ACTN|nr:class I SAM-dependent methyltransferase [Frankia canadensis]SNQ49657.1 Methyltransferase family protein [Frankia canadensis]SOU56947.1 Methyltransferase family protein [Frankia canadensis]
MALNRRGWLPVVVGVGIGLNTARLRGRLHAIDVVPTEVSGAAAVGPAGTAPTRPEEARERSRYVLLSAAGTRLTAGQRRAAEEHARRNGLDVLDLVPANLPAHRVLDLARMVDPATYRAQPLTRGRGAGLAVLIDQEVLARIGLATADQPRFHGRSEVGDLTEAELVAIVQLGKRHAAASTDLAVLPGLRGPGAGAGAGDARLSVQQTAYAWEPARRVLPALRDGALLLGAASNPSATLGALALSWVQPALVGGGHVRVDPAALGRSLLARRQIAVAQVRHARARAREFLGEPQPTVTEAAGTSRLVVSVRPAAADVDRARPGYQADLAVGVERFLEDRRDSCPWCGGRDLTLRLRGRDVAQRKPGEFQYDRCGDCGHIFQNPRLSPDGLEFYYRDFYDGLGGAALEEVFGYSVDPYLQRARQPIATPRRWLDVGGGHGHFCAMARTVWPATSFDALDIGAGIEEAARRRWVDHAYRGFFPDLVAEVKGRYDIISMFHYLEHTRDPLTELDAAAAALEPGGHLLIEVPNPDSPAARWYRSLWPGWLVPQHQHLIPAANLVAALERRGFAVPEPVFGEVHQKGDPVMAVYGLLQTLAPSPSVAWRAPASPGRGRAARALTAGALVPAFVAALVTDEATRPYLTTGTRANAYRILARRL